MHRAAGVELAATCHICLKTKFADGVGHSCHYCRVRCCARCGGKVTLRSNKVTALLPAPHKPDSLTFAASPISRGVFQKRS